ncbi:MAG TPA: hypothetical protein VMH61_05145 [Candidatus Acidoferrales bacterium]|nr:hypothetical protein [Candidatus Acidoferrales bacterium]
MRPFRPLLAPALAALALLAASTAGAWSRPELDLSFGQSFGPDGQPSGGGTSIAFAPMWPAGDRTRFGVSLFADDIGSTIVPLTDLNSGQYLGLSASLHRWTWGAAWRGDVVALRRPHWSSSLRGEWGWWRIEDDTRGTILGATSAIGVGAGLEARRRFAEGHDIGFNVNYRQLFDARESNGRHPWHYATAAVEWCWSGRAHSTAP